MPRKAQVRPQQPAYWHPTGLGSLTFDALVGHFHRMIETLSDLPVLIGHSLGGLLVQKLVNDGYGRAGIAIGSTPPPDITACDPGYLWSNLWHLNLAAGNSAAVVSPDRLHYRFANTMTRRSSDRIYEQYVVPESRKVARTALTRQARIDFTKEHVPLLMIAGARDTVTPVELIRKNATAYDLSTGIVDFRYFADRSHLICLQDGWREVADFVLDWLGRRVG